MDRRDEDVRAEIERRLAEASRLDRRADELYEESKRLADAARLVRSRAMRLRLSRLDLETPLSARVDIEATLQETPDAER